jgi:hypothetical protein
MSPSFPESDVPTLRQPHQSHLWYVFIRRGCSEMKSRHHGVAAFMFMVMSPCSSCSQVQGNFQSLHGVKQKLIQCMIRVLLYRLHVI